MSYLLHDWGVEMHKDFQSFLDNKPRTRLSKQPFPYATFKDFSLNFYLIRELVENRELEWQTLHAEFVVPDPEHKVRYILRCSPK